MDPVNYRLIASLNCSFINITYSAGIWRIDAAFIGFPGSCLGWKNDKIL